MRKNRAPLAAITMGSQSDWEVMKYGAETLQKLEVPHTVDITSAHRAAEVMRAYALRTQKQVRLLIAGAGGSAHLPGMIASFAHNLHVFGVPIPTKNDPQGNMALDSMIGMPEGCPMSVMPVGKAGAVNAALLIANNLAPEFPKIQKALLQFREEQKQKVAASRKWIRQFTIDGGR